MRRELQVEPSTADSPIDALGMFLAEQPTHVVIDGAGDMSSGVRVAAAMARSRPTSTVLLVEPEAVELVRAQVARRGLEGITVRAWVADVPALFVEVGEEPIGLLLRRSFEAILLLGSAGTPHMLPTMLPRLRPGAVPLIVGVHHNPRLSESFAEWVGELTGAEPEPFRAPSNTYTLPALSVARADAGVGELQPDLDGVVRRACRGRQAVGIVVASGMRLEGFGALTSALDRGATLVALHPDRCSQPAMVQRLLDANLDPTLCTEREVAEFIGSARRVASRQVA